MALSLGLVISLRYKENSAVSIRLMELLTADRCMVFVHVVYAISMSISNFVFYEGDGGCKGLPFVLGATVIVHDTGSMGTAEAITYKALTEEMTTGSTTNWAVSVADDRVPVSVLSFMKNIGHPIGAISYGDVVAVVTLSVTTSHLHVSMS